MMSIITLTCLIVGEGVLFAIFCDFFTIISLRYDPLRFRIFLEKFNTPPLLITNLPAPVDLYELHISEEKIYKTKLQTQSKGKRFFSEKIKRHDTQGTLCKV